MERDAIRSEEKHRSEVRLLLSSGVKVVDIIRTIDGHRWRGEKAVENIDTVCTDEEVQGLSTLLIFSSPPFPFPLLSSCREMNTYI